MEHSDMKIKLPNLHKLKASDEELFVKNTLPKKTIPHIYHSNVDSNRANYDNYMFRCHALSKLVGGIPKPPSERQIETYSAYKFRFENYGVLLSGEKGERGKQLSIKQENDFYSIGKRLTEELKLSDAAKGYCEELVNQDNMGYSSSIKTMQMEKGIVRENDSIALYSKFIEKELEKNVERSDNGYWSGEWDLDEDINTIVDIKTSWTRQTFAQTAINHRSKGYDWQGQGYLDLTGKNIFKIVYCLVDSIPEHVNNLVNRMLFNPDYGTVSGEVEEFAIPIIVEEVTNHFVTKKALEEFCKLSGVVHIDWFNDFYEIPFQKRIKIFQFDRDEKMINDLKSLIVLARHYMNEIKNT